MRASNPVPPTAPSPVQAQQTPMLGTTSECDNFRLALLPLGLLDFDLPDEGWVWVEPNGRRFRSMSGLVVSSKVASNDTGANHDSHDMDPGVLVDPGQEDLLSSINSDFPDDPRLPPELERGVDTIGIEWETGIKPSEKKGDGARPTFPKWAWPSIGDRVWTNGHWIFDCGHPTEFVVGTVDSPIGPIPVKEKRYRAEIHPARAIASMRDQARPLPGSGGLSVPVTATDLYIHGRAGFVIDQLHCGMSIIVDGVNGSGDPDACPTKTSPIDVDFTFDVCLPPRPAGATLTWAVEAGPGNTIDIAPDITPVPAAGACLLGDQFDHTEMLRVTAPLGGSGVVPEDIYARRIDAGWVGGNQPKLRRFRVTLNQMDLHKDHDDVPTNQGELSFFWMNVNRAYHGEWIRLSDFAEGNMNNYDDSPGTGDGEMDFTGAVFEFDVRPGQTFTIAANGYDQDCLDDTFGDHTLSILSYASCYTINFNEAGNNDALVSLPSKVAPEATTFGPASTPEYGIGAQDLAALYQIANPFGTQPPVLTLSEYELEITIEEIFDVTPPTTTPSPSVGANANGWNNTDVTVQFGAADEVDGSGVAALVVTATGAHTFQTEVAGSSTSVALTNEGITTLTYYARDVQGNVEEPKTLVIRIDKTAPTIAGSRAPDANQYGWNNTDVTVSFTCADALSGIADCGPVQVITTEGTNQSRTGVATDLAGNTASAAVGGINIDKTPPALTGLPANCVLWPPQHQLLTIGTVTVTDNLSGVLPGSFSLSGASSEPANGQGDGDTSPDVIITDGTVQLRAERAGSGTGRVYSLGGTAQDLAGNVGTIAGTCTVPISR